MRYSLFLVLMLAACSSPRAREVPRESSDDVRPAPAPVADDHRKVIVVFGDSISAGFGLSTGQSFPDYLQKRLDSAGYSYRVANLGISGDTTDGGAARIDSATSLKPSIVV